MKPVPKITGKKTEIGGAGGEDVEALKTRIKQLEKDKAGLESQNKSLQSQLQAAKKNSKGSNDAGQPPQKATSSIRSSNDADHLVKTVAMMQHTANAQSAEIENLKSIIEKGASFQVQDLLNQAKDKDRVILNQKKELKTLERMYKLNKDQTADKLQDDIRSLKAQIKAYVDAAIVSDRIRDQYSRKISKLREELKMTKMFKFDPSAAM